MYYFTYVSDCNMQHGKMKFDKTRKTTRNKEENWKPPRQICQRPGVQTSLKAFFRVFEHPRLPSGRGENMGTGGNLELLEKFRHICVVHCIFRGNWKNTKPSKKCTQNARQTNKYERRAEAHEKLVKCEASSSLSGQPNRAVAISFCFSHGSGSASHRVN